MADSDALRYADFTCDLNNRKLSYTFVLQGYVISLRNLLHYPSRIL